VCVQTDRAGPADRLAGWALARNLPQAAGSQLAMPGDRLAPAWQLLVLTLLSTAHAAGAKDKHEVGGSCCWARVASRLCRSHAPSPLPAPMSTSYMSAGVRSSRRERWSLCGTTKSGRTTTLKRRTSTSTCPSAGPMVRVNHASSQPRLTASIRALLWRLGPAGTHPFWVAAAPATAHALRLHSREKKGGPW
jgi:hypothetical protein